VTMGASQEGMNRKRALLIVPPTGKYIREDRCQTPIEDFATIALRPPIDLLYIAASLEEQGLECRIRDYPAEDRAWSDFEQDFRQFQPDLLLLSITTPSLKDDLKACRIAKELRPQCLTVAKGAHFFYSDRDTLARYPHLDAVIRGEYETTAGEIARANSFDPVPGITYRGNGVIQRNPDRPLLEDLDRLPYPARHLLKNELYIRPDTGEPQTTIITSRGCPYACVFCLSRQVAGSRLRQRSVGNVLGELRQCIEQHGIRDFLFRSDTFTLNKDWVLELCEGIVREGLDIRWSCNSRVDTLDRERLEAMQRAGCWLIAFGVESGSDELLRRMKKGASVEQARQAIRLCREAGVKSSVYLLVGLPWETEESFHRTSDLAVELDPDYLEVFYVYPFQGTELYDIAVKEGLLEEGAFPVDSYSRPAMPTHDFTVEQLSHLRRKLLRRFYLRPSYIARTLWRSRSPKVFANYVRYGTRQLVDLLTGA